MIEWEKGREIARGRDNKLHGERKREREITYFSRMLQVFHQ
jgi:hypothetical protein